MRLTRIEIDGYGSLRDFRVEIAPGLHVFYGPNESGKSTLQRSILALLYGFYASERARAAENAALPGRAVATPPGWSTRWPAGLGIVSSGTSACRTCRPRSGT